MDQTHIKTVRGFNRAVTQRIGALQDDYLSRGRPLGEARLIFEAGLDGAVDVRDIRRKLGLNTAVFGRLFCARWKRRVSLSLPPSQTTRGLASST